MVEGLISAGTGLMLVRLARQMRLILRDRGDRLLARHVFDHTRSTDALAGYTRLLDERGEG